jgi:hypothetical protein
MSTTPAEQLRQRARTLRSLDRRLQQLLLLTLPPAAGPQTWVGPSPQACYDDLRARRELITRATDELACEARRLERIADDLDARPATPGVR